MAREAGAPRLLEDFPWRVGYRLRWLGFTLFGPAQLEGEDDPMERLKREKRRRYAVRAARRRLEQSP
jgi:hypothetical protein